MCLLTAWYFTMLVIGFFILISSSFFIQHGHLCFLQSFIWTNSQHCVCVRGRACVCSSKILFILNRGHCNVCLWLWVGVYFACILAIYVFSVCMRVSIHRIHMCIYYQYIFCNFPFIQATAPGFGSRPWSTPLTQVPACSPSWLKSSTTQTLGLQVSCVFHQCLVLLLILHFFLMYILYII